MDPVFLLSPGRSGSTLLQRHLNCSSDLILWGEHGGFLRGLRNTYRGWSENKHVQHLLNKEGVYAKLLLSSQAAVGVDVEWTNNFSREHFKEKLANMIADLFTIDVPYQVRWGFKEIRYDDNDVFFLKELFPDAQFVFVVRDPIDTLASAIVAFAKGQDLWESKDRSESTEIQIIEQIQVWSDKLSNIAQGISACVKKVGYLVKYEELKDNPVEIISTLCQRLNISTPSIEHTIQISGDVRHGMNTTEVRRRLMKEFLNEPCIQGLMSIYKSFGYNQYPIT
jgi:LPS sulfotransferase NodH